MGTHVGWSERETALVQELINAIKEGHAKPLRHAADVVGMEYSTARNTLYRIRNRHYLMRDAIEKYSKWRREMRGRRFL